MGYAKLIKNYSPEIIQLTQTNYNQLHTNVKNNGNLYVTTDTHQIYQNSQGFIPSTATTAADGLMSSVDKTKLNGIATGAEVNQNAFSNVKIGSTTIAADSKTDTLTLTAGNNITLTPATATDTITIAVNGTNTVGNNSNVPTGAAIQSYVTGLGYTNNTGTVTKIIAGTGLSGGTITSSGTIALTESGVTAGSAGPTAAVTGTEGTTIQVPRITVDKYGRVTSLTSQTLTNKNTTYSNVGTSGNSGLMTTADKVILDNLNKSSTTILTTADLISTYLGSATTYYNGNPTTGPTVTKMGKMCTLILDFVNRDSAIASDTGLHSIATLPSKYKPAIRINANSTPNKMPPANATFRQLPYVRIETNGTIMIGNFKSTQMEGLRACVTYVAANTE